MIPSFSFLKDLNLPKQPPQESSVAVSESPPVKNESRKAQKAKQTKDAKQSNGAKRKHITPDGKDSRDRNENAANDEQASGSKEPGTKKKKRIAPESVTHASAALFAAFLSKKNVQDAGTQMQSPQEK